MRMSSRALAREKMAGPLVSDHQDVRSYWQVEHDKARYHLDVVRNEPWSDEDKEVLRLRGTQPLRLSLLKSSERAMIGYFSKSGFNVKFSQVGTDSSEAASVYQSIYTRDYRANKGRLGDAKGIHMAWATGLAHCAIYVENVMGDWQARWKWLDRSQVFWDPESKDLGTREDARFVDTEALLGEDAFISAFPEYATAAESAFRGGGSYEQVEYVHDDINQANFRNGKVLLIERYYKTIVTSYDLVDQDGLIWAEEVAEHEQALAAVNDPENPSITIIPKSREELWYCAAAPHVTEKMLYNGKYPLQPRDPQTGDLLWPIQELVAESLGNLAVGFVEPQIDSVRAYNAIMASIAASAKHSASQSKVADESAFKSAAEAQRFAREHTNPGAVFYSKPGMAERTHISVAKSAMSSDAYQAVNILREVIEDVSGTPPAFKGTDFRTNISTGTTSQRIEQGGMGLAHFVDNVVDFLRRRAHYLANIWAEYYDKEEVVEITSSEDEDVKKYVAINGTNEIRTADVLRYKVFVEESPYSETNRQRLQSQIIEMTQSPAIQQDPVLIGTLVKAWARLGDMPNWLKLDVANHSSIVQQYEEQRRQAELMQQQAQLQQSMAQTAGQDASNVQAMSPQPPQEMMQ